MAGWGDGFIRGYDLGCSRMCIAIRRELILRGMAPKDVEVVIDYAYMNAQAAGPGKTERG